MSHLKKAVMFTFKLFCLVTFLFSIVMIVGGECAEDNPSSFSKLIQEGLKRNPQVASIEARFAATCRNKEIYLSDFLPQVSLNGSSAYETNRTESTSSDEYPARVELNLTQLIFDRKAIIKYGNAGIEILAMALEVKNIRENVLLDMLTNMINLQKSRDAAALLKSYYELTNVHLTATKLRSNIGELTITDVNQTLSRLSLAHVDWLSSLNEIKRQEVVFDEYFGTTPPEHIVLPPFADLIGQIKDDEIVKMVMARPDIRAQEYSVVLAERDVVMAKGGHYPTLSLNSSSYREWVSDTDTTRSEYGYDVGLQLSLPLYSGGRTTALTRQALDMSRVEKENMNQLLLQGVRQVKEALSDRNSAKEVLSAYDRAVVAAQSTLEGIDVEFKAGTRTSTDLLDAQKELFNTKLMQIASHYKVMLASIQLLKAVGILEEKVIKRE
ncbi:MAG: TolC family protein [Desulfamplus sp.]|nr:TolC family protein [Desulfamplus sp.]